jgi:hypothetical protein
MIIKAIRIPAESKPGATATDLWEIAGLPYQNLPVSIVMSPEDMVDAALVGLADLLLDRVQLAADLLDQ